MKKAGKRVLFGSLLLVVLMFTMTFTVFAARNIPKKVRAYPNRSGMVYLTLNRCEYIKITSAKGLNAHIYSEGWDTQLSTSSARILYITNSKAGEYKIVLNIYDALTNKKKTSATINIYSYDGGPIKKILVNGKENNVLSDYKKPTFTFKVQMNSGYTLKKLEYEVYGKPKTTTTKNGNMTQTLTESSSIFKKFKNGGSVPASQNGNVIYLRDGERVNNDGTTNKWHEMRENYSSTMAIIRITYADKYTKEEVSYLSSVYFSNN